jgi:hypothetical protein
MKNPFANMNATAENLAVAGERVEATFNSAAVIMVAVAAVALAALGLAIVAVMK